LLDEAPADFSAGASSCPPVARRRYDLWRIAAVPAKAKISIPHIPSSTIGGSMHSTRNPSALLLSTYLEVGLGWLRPSTKAAVRFLVAAGGSPASMAGLLRASGCRDRHQLAYCLRRDGLPPLRQLAAWIKLLTWAADHELGGTSLCKLALAEAGDPAVRYRLVKRLTRLTWTQVSHRGFAWVGGEFLAKCEAPPAYNPTRAISERWCS
jgi:hypothetical protein